MPKAPLDPVLADLRKTFGEKTVMYASEMPRGTAIPTGSLALDVATEYGGFPSNRVVEIGGLEGTGKTTLALMSMLNALERNPQRGALFLDTEHKLDQDWLEMIVGKDVMKNRLIYIQPTSIEHATNIYRKALDSGSVCIAILDSIGGSPTVRRNDDATVGHYGGNSIGVGEFARASATMSAVHDCCTIGINQARADMSGYNQYITTGGWAWRYHCTMRVELKKGKDVEMIKPPGEDKPFPVGRTIYAKIRKNGVGAEGRTCYYWFYNVWTPEWGFGVDRLDEITRLGLKTRTIKTSGGWYSHPALPGGKVQGLLKLKDAVKGDEALAKTLSSEILASLEGHIGDVAPISDPEAPIEEMTSSLFLEGEMA